MTNILLIMTDQQRYDSLGCLGNPAARTPALDALGARSVRFRRHLTPNQICSPSRGTLFSGLYPRHHGMHRNGVALDTSLELISHVLRAAGYRTHGVGKFHFEPMAAPAESGLHESWAFWQDAGARDWRGPFYGFDTVDMMIGESAYCTNGGHYAAWLRDAHPGTVGLYAPECALAPSPPDLDEVWKCAVPAELHYNAWIADRAVDFLQALPADERFFLFVSFPDPHHPFSPPAPYCDRHDPDNMPPPRVVSGELERMPSYIRDQVWFTDETAVENPKASYLECVLNALEPRESWLLRTDGISEASLRLAIAYTQASIEMIDDGVARVMGALQARGLDEDTIVIFTSDHGELLGDHGLLHKGPPPYRQLVQVPLLMAGPGLPAKEVTALTSHLDLKATVLDLLGLAGDPGEGVSLAPLVRGEASRVRDTLFGEYHPRLVADQYNQTVVNDDWRFTRYPLRPEWGELFDLGADPHEHHNLFAEPAAQEVVRRLGRRLDEDFPARPEIDSTVLGIY